MPWIVLNPSGARRPALKAMSPRVLMAVHPKLLGSKPSSTLSATLVKVYCGAGGAVCARASESIAPSAMASPTTRANTITNRRRFDDLWCVNIPPPPSEATPGRVRAASWLSLATLYGNWQDQRTFAPFFIRADTFPRMGYVCCYLAVACRCELLRTP